MLCTYAWRVVMQKDATGKRDLFCIRRRDCVPHQPQMPMRGRIRLQENTSPQKKEVILLYYYQVSSQLPTMLPPSIRSRLSPSIVPKSSFQIIFFLIGFFHVFLQDFEIISKGTSLCQDKLKLIVILISFIMINNVMCPRHKKWRQVQR